MCSMSTDATCIPADRRFHGDGRVHFAPFEARVLCKAQCCFRESHFDETTVWSLRHRVENDMSTRYHGSNSSRGCVWRRTLHCDLDLAVSHDDVLCTTLRFRLNTQWCGFRRFIQPPHLNDLRSLLET